MHALAPATAAGGLVYVSGVCPSPAVLAEPIQRQVSDAFGHLATTLQTYGSTVVCGPSPSDAHVQIAAIAVG
jgi:enamine deaminase RidA (YjgF/YER057c/UK114 family)